MGQIEVDPYCRTVLERHWPGVWRRGDIRLVDPADCPAVDLVCGGFPCVDLSSARTASPRRGLAGRQSGLWTALARLVAGVRPRWLLVENSPRWQSWVPAVRAELARHGYASLPLVVSAAFVGAPHARPRAFVVAHADGDGESLGAVDAEMARLCPIPSAAWPPERGALDVDDGVSRGMALAALGNAVLPPVAETIGRAILAVEATHDRP